MVSTPHASRRARICRIAKPRHADDPFCGSRALSQTRQSRAYFAADTENENIAVESLQIVNQRPAGPRQQLFQ